jgi:hypothetical protein
MVTIFISNGMLVSDHQSVPVEDHELIISAWRHLRHIWLRPVTITFTFEPRPSQDTTCVESTCQVVEEEQIS